MVMIWWVHLLVGLAFVGTCVIGIVFKLLHSMTPENHNWRKCRCEVCSHKRYLTRLRQDAEDKRRKIVWSDEGMQPPQPDQIRAHFISTAQLEEGMFVRLHDKLYLVSGVSTGTNGYAIRLKNVKTRINFVVQVSYRIGNQKMWEPAEWWRRS